MRRGWTLFLCLGLTTSSASNLGCSDCSVDGQDPVVYDGGVTNSSQTVYQSSRIGEPYLHFPQGRVYQFYHGLGRAPVDVEIFVSFCERLEDNEQCPKKRSRNVALTSGNMSVIEVWNDEMIQIRNDTCENQLYIRAIAEADPDEAIVGGASGGPG